MTESRIEEEKKSGKYRMLNAICVQLAKNDLKRGTFVTFKDYSGRSRKRRFFKWSGTEMVLSAFSYSIHPNRITLVNGKSRNFHEMAVELYNVVEIVNIENKEQLHNAVIGSQIDD